jgi:hypothetical protein
MMIRRRKLALLLAIGLSGLAFVATAQERDATDASAALARRGEGLIVAQRFPKRKRICS